MANRKQQYFLSLYKPVHDRFERFCRARAFYYMPHEDLINETLLIAFKQVHTLKNTEAFLSFLIGISIKILANARRKKKPVNLDFDQLQYPDPKNQLEQLSDTDLLYTALAKLPEPQKEALVLFELTGFSIKEIMEIQNSTESAVKQRLRRGRQNLARIVKENCAYKMDNPL